MVAVHSGDNGPGYYNASIKANGALIRLDFGYTLRNLPSNLFPKLTIRCWLSPWRDFW